MKKPLTFRDAATRDVPSWMTAHWALRFIYAAVIHIDALIDAATAAVEIRFPGVYSNESLPLLGRERGIIPGTNEPADSFAGRLCTWMDDRRHKGNPYALMRQLLGLLSPRALRIAVVNNDGTRYEIGTDGKPVLPVSTSWDWDGDSTQTSRRWVIIYATDGVWQDEGTFADPGAIGDGGVIGSTASFAEVETIGQVTATWTAPHCKTENVIVVLDETAWEAQQPNGTWDRWVNRNRSVLYFQGS